MFLTAMFGAALTRSQWTVVGIGTAAFVAGVIFIVMGVLSKKKLNVMKETPTVKAAEVAQHADPAGTNRIEIFGVAECESPLVAPGTGTRCLYYRHNVERQVERRVTDSEGNYHTERDWDTVCDNKSSMPFTIRDETGVVRVVPDGAEFVAQITMNDQIGSYGYKEYEAMQQSGGGGILGGVLNTAMDIAVGTSVPVYRTSEWIVPVGQNVYVNGVVYQTPAGPEIRDSKGPFIVSFKSEEGLSKKYTWHTVLWSVFGVLFSASGIAAAVYGYKFMNK